MTLEIFSIVAGGVSVFVGFIAIAVSIYFFVQAKNTETRTAGLLSSMESEVRHLSDITSQQTDRLLETVSTIAERQATDPYDPTGMFDQVVETITRLGVFQVVGSATTVDAGTPNTITGHEIPELIDPINVHGLRSAVAHLYIVLYLYTGVSNTTVQLQTPTRSEFEPGNEHHAKLKQYLDASHRDFHAIRNVLLQYEKIHGEVLQSNPLFADVMKLDPDYQTAVLNSDQTMDRWEELLK